MLEPQGYQYIDLKQSKTTTTNPSPHCTSKVNGGRPQKWISKLGANDLQAEADRRMPGVKDTSVNSGNHVSSPNRAPWVKLPDVLSPTLKQLRFQLNELLHTEDTYVASLHDLDQGYLLRLREDVTIDENMLTVIFYRITDLRLLHHEFNVELHSAEHDLGRLARVFINFSASMKSIYVDYCVTYPDSVHLVELAQNQQNHFWSQIVACQRQLGHLLPLCTYLLKPVQRILKYQLILQECIHHCSNAIKQLKDLLNSSKQDIPPYSASQVEEVVKTLQEDLPILRQGCNCMVELANHINERKRCHDLINHLRRFNNHLINIDNCGDLVLRDYFQLPGKKEPRFVILFQRAILLCKHSLSAVPSSKQTSSAANAGSYSTLCLRTLYSGQNGSSPALLETPTTSTLTLRSNSVLPTSVKQGELVEIREVINCANLMLIECIPKNPLAFHILPFGNPKAQRTLQAPSLDVKRLWCREIKRLILDTYDTKIPEKAKQIVLNMPDLINGTPTADCPVTSGSSTLIGQRLAKRSRSVHNHTEAMPQTPTDSPMRFFQAINGVTSSLSSHGLDNHTVSNQSEDNPEDALNGDGLSTDLAESIHRLWSNLWVKQQQAQSPPETIPEGVGGDIPTDGHQGSSEDPTDYRCIAVDINEERLHQPVTPVSPSRPPPPLFNRYKKSRAPSLPCTYRSVPSLKSSSTDTPSETLTGRASTPSQNSQGEDDSPSLFINCPETNISAGQFYDQYIVKTRIRLALSPDDLDAIFHPLHELAHVPDSPSRSLEKRSGPVHGLPQSSDRSPPVDYRSAPPPVSWLTAVHEDRVHHQPVADWEDGRRDWDSSCSSSTTSSPRHVVSTIALQEFRRKESSAAESKTVDSSPEEDSGYPLTAESVESADLASPSHRCHYSTVDCRNGLSGGGSSNASQTLTETNKSASRRPEAALLLPDHRQLTEEKSISTPSVKQVVESNSIASVQSSSGLVEALRLRNLFQLPTSRKPLRGIHEDIPSTQAQPCTNPQVSQLKTRSLSSHPPGASHPRYGHSDRRNSSPFRSDVPCRYTRKKSRAPDPPDLGQERAPLAEEESGQICDSEETHVPGRSGKHGSRLNLSSKTNSLPKSRERREASQPLGKQATGASAHTHASSMEQTARCFPLQKHV